MGCLVAWVFVWHSNLSDGEISRASCVVIMPYFEHTTPQNPQRCRILPEGCGKMLSFGGKLWQGWVFWRLFDRFSFFFIVVGVVGFFLRTILS